MAEDSSLSTCEDVWPAMKNLAVEQPLQLGMKAKAVLEMHFARPSAPPLLVFQLTSEIATKHKTDLTASLKHGNISLASFLSCLDCAKGPNRQYVLDPQNSEKIIVAMRIGCQPPKQGPQQPRLPPPYSCPVPLMGCSVPPPGNGQFLPMGPSPPSMMPRPMGPPSPSLMTMMPSTPPSLPFPPFQCNGPFQGGPQFTPFSAMPMGYNLPPSSGYPPVYIPLHQVIPPQHLAHNAAHPQNPPSTMEKQLLQRSDQDVRAGASPVPPALSAPSTRNSVAAPSSTTVSSSSMPRKLPTPLWVPTPTPTPSHLNPDAPAFVPGCKVPTESLPSHSYSSTFCDYEPSTPFYDEATGLFIVPQPEWRSEEAEDIGSLYSREDTESIGGDAESEERRRRKRAISQRAMAIIASAPPPSYAKTQQICRQINCEIRGSVRMCMDIQMLIEALSDKMKLDPKMAGDVNVFRTFIEKYSKTGHVEGYLTDDDILYWKDINDTRAKSEGRGTPVEAAIPSVVVLPSAAAPPPVVEAAMTPEAAKAECLSRWSEYKFMARLLWMLKTVYGNSDIVECSAISQKLGDLSGGSMDWTKYGIMDIGSAILDDIITPVSDEAGNLDYTQLRLAPAIRCVNFVALKRGLEQEVYLVLKDRDTREMDDVALANEITNHPRDMLTSSSFVFHPQQTQVTMIQEATAKYPQLFFYKEFNVCLRGEEGTFVVLDE